MEQYLDRPLRSEEIVHHIDCDKSNNASGNLFLFDGRSGHRKAHCSIERLMPVLLERGIVYFDRIEGIYKPCEIRK